MVAAEPLKKKLGYLGSTLPQEAGGAGLSYIDYGLLLEALAAGPVVLGEVVPPRTLFYLRSPEQKARCLPRLLSGDMVGTAAITEPQAGSDMRNLQTTAVREDDSFVVNGRKKWIKLGGVCDAMTFFFQAEDGIRAGRVTGVQTCALPISPACGARHRASASSRRRRTTTSTRSRIWRSSFMISRTPIRRPASA